MIARSASANTDDWPFWLVSETPTSPNITPEVAARLGSPLKPGAAFVDRASAQRLVAAWKDYGPAARG